MRSFGIVAPFAASRLAVLPLLAAAVLAAASVTFAQTTATAPASAPAIVSAPAASAPASAPAAPTPATAPAAAASGTVKGDRVNLRAGPSENYYVIGQLHHGDTAQILGEDRGWYKIVPPAGSFSYISKDFVEVDADGKSGTVKGDNIRVRAGSALAPASDYVVQTDLRKGTKVVITGTTDKYYKIVPPEKVGVYVKAELIQPAPGAVIGSTLRLPVGTTLPAATETAVVRPPAVPTGPENGVPIPGPVPATQTATTRVVPVAPVPAPAFNQDAYAKFEALNTRTQSEFQNKPLLKRDLAGLLNEYKALADTANVPPSVKLGSEARIDALEKAIKVQQIAKEVDSSSNTALQEQVAAQARQWKDMQDKLDAMERSGPPLAAGRVETSSVVSRYALVDPATKRVTAYLDPSSDIDLAKLLGAYIEVRGAVVQSEGQTVKVIKVRTATVAPAPQ